MALYGRPSLTHVMATPERWAARRVMARAADVASIWGSVALAWADVISFRGRLRFILSFVRFLQYR